MKTWWANLKGKTKNTNQKFLGISQLDWELEINNDECETILFPLPISWYSEVFENYNSIFSHQMR